MRRLWKGRPFAMKKMEQLWRLVRESHERPMTGVARPVELVEDDELGVTFIGHSSFLLQVDGRKVLVDPVFSKRLIVLRRQRRPGLRVDELPPIDLVLLTHAHMDRSGHGFASACHTGHPKTDRNDPRGCRAQRR